MTTERRLRKPFQVFLPGLLFLITSLLTSPCFGQSVDPDCAAIADKWGQVIRQLDAKLNEFASIQHTSADRFAQRPVTDGASGQTIARRIADVLRAKEDLLNAKRRECRDLMGVEDDLFAKVQDCASNGGDSRNRDTKKLAKQRSAIIEKALLTLSEVKEVEGKETALPYTEAMRGRDPYAASQQQSYWQNYQQMYRRWWGY